MDTIAPTFNQTIHMYYINAYSLKKMYKFRPGYLAKTGTNKNKNSCKIPDLGPTVCMQKQHL